MLVSVSTLFFLFSHQALGKITSEGVFLEQLEKDPSKYLPEVTTGDLGDTVLKIDLNRPMADVLAELTQYPIRTRLSLTGEYLILSLFTRKVLSGSFEIQS